eukprot:3292680-Lingulodinium_polyedra.AAC.1
MAARRAPKLRTERQLDWLRNDRVLAIVGRATTGDFIEATAAYLALGRRLRIPTAALRSRRLFFNGGGRPYKPSPNLPGSPPG